MRRSAAVEHGSRDVVSVPLVLTVVVVVVVQGPCLGSVCALCQGTTTGPYTMLRGKQPLFYPVFSRLITC